MAVRLTASERFIIKQKAERAGMTLTAYLRHMAIHGKIIDRLNEEDRKNIRQLIQMNNEIHELVVLAEKEGMVKATVQYEGLRSSTISSISPAAFIPILLGIRPATPPELQV